jgi:hypothetical protein
MRYIMTVAGVLAVLATQAQAESQKYRTILVPEKSVQACSGWGQTYTVDTSNGVLTLGVNYARKLFSEPLKGDGTITTSYKDPSGGTLKFIGHGNGEYELIAPRGPCYYRFVPTEKPPWNGLAGASHTSSAANASWVAAATLEDGISPSCVGGQIGAQPEYAGQGDWQVDIRGNTLTYSRRATNRSFTLDLKALQPDGSGKVVGKDDKNRDFYLTFDPGSGARPFHVTNSITPCRTVFTPRT